MYGWTEICDQKNSTNGQIDEIPSNSTGFGHHDVRIIHHGFLTHNAPNLNCVREVQALKHSCVD